MAWRRALAAAAALTVFVYAAVAADTVLRARAACREGERWLAWSRHPEQRRARLDAELEERRAELERERAAGRLGGEEYAKRLGLARFERDRAEAEGTAKFAALWLESAAGLFTPPESRWSVRARAELVEARALWRRELQARGLPADDYRLE
jgi:hypothetical protein